MSYHVRLKIQAQRIVLVISAIVTSFAGTLLVSVLKPVMASADSDTYSWSNATYVDANYDWGYSTCPSNDGGCMAMYGYNAGVKYGEADPWVYNLRNCTSYVAEKISQEFNGRNVSGWKNAAQWATYAQAANYTLDSSPVTGDIAVWGTEKGGGYGHVAYVYNVSSGIGSLDEYNVAGTGQFTTNRTTASGSAGAADWYIHMGTPSDSGGGGGSGGSTTPRVTPLQFNSEMDIFKRGANNDIVKDTIQSGSSSSGGWNSLGGVLASNPSADQYGSGEMDVFATNSVGALCQITYQSSTNSWGGWTLRANNMAGDPTSIAYNGKLYVFSRGTDGNLYVILERQFLGWAQPDRWQRNHCHGEQSHGHHLWLRNGCLHPWYR